MTSWNRRTGKRILVVEDSITQAEQLAGILVNHGYEAAVAPDGEQALMMVREQQPALIISDVVMPKLDGYGLCTRIKSDPQLKHIPIVLVTTLSDPNDVLRGLECGADNFIRKPIDQRYLLSRIDYLLMNVELRLHQKTQMGLEIDLRGQRYFINSDRQQILDLLISTYEQAVDLNKELSQRERELAKSNEVLDSLYRIADDLNQAVTVREILDKVIERVMDFPDVSGAWITLPHNAKGEFTIQAARGLPLNIGDEHPNINCQCVTGLINGDIGSPTNIFNCECLATLNLSPNSRCHATVPLTLSSGRKMGVLNLLSPDEYGFDDAQLQLLSGVGNQLSVALERAELHENLEHLVHERTVQVDRLNRLYSVLSGINSTIVRTRSQTDLFNEVCRITIDEGEFAFAWIGTVDSDGRNIKHVACAHSTGTNPSSEEIDEAVADIEHSGVLTQQLQAGDVVIKNNIAVEENVPGHWRRDYHSIAMMPLLREGVLAGVCVLYALEPDAFDDKQEMDLLTEIAGDIGFALDSLDKDRRLNYQAYYDKVTGLPNRTLFADRLNQAILEGSRNEERGVVAILDLDRFKTINDSLGHSIGDAFLKAVAQRLGKVVRESDTVARITGDEFGLLFADLKQPFDITQIITKVLDCFSTPFTIGNHELFVSASLGVSIFPTDGDSIDALMQNADAAMNRAKKDGGNGYQFYSSDMTSRARERLTLENDLRRALERNEFILHYQPIVQANTCKITGVETLVRWLSPERGLVPPFSFIPVAEETSLIVDIGAWVMEESCRQVAQEWKRTAPRLSLSVNVSTRQFLQENFLEMVTGVLERTGMDPRRLTLEITESHLMESIDDMIAIMHQLGKLGIGFSIDDFGTGYSSLSYLTNLPIANLKVDRSFVKDLPDNTNDAIIAKTIISMAHSLGQNVIAEGVETREQLEFLRTHACDSIQGYYFSKPLPANEITPLLEGEFLKIDG